MITNAYNTTDPDKLLKLKRLEADALLDVLRTINQDEVTIEQLCMIARNVLRVQLGVKKLIFYYEFEEEWTEGMRRGFEAMDLEALQELIDFTKITKVTAGFSPALYAHGAEYVVPIRQRGSPSAYFLIADFADSEIEVKNDLIFIETLGSILNVAIQNRQLVNEKLQQEFLKKELEVAEAIQKQLLISDFSRFKQIDVFAMNTPHHGIGGDYYDVVKKGKDTTFVCIADVAGKGIGAALLMSNLQANFRALCAQYMDIAKIVEDLNRIIFNITEGERFITFFLVRVDQAKQSFSYINSGHNYPYFYQGESFLELSEGCPPLGVIPEVSVQETSIDFQTSDGILMYTDGVTEQCNRAGDMYGEDRLKQLLSENRELNSLQLINLLRQELVTFSEGTLVADDVTLLNMRFVNS